MSNYDYILDKIHALKTQYPSLRERTDDYAFSALCIKANFYKNPALVLHEEDFAEMIVDGSNDLGIDILLSDPNSDAADLVIGQSKFCKAITYEQVLSAMRKMADGYKELLNGHYEQANEQLGSRFVELYDKVDEESKIRFVFYTSAPKKRIDKNKLEAKFLEEFIDTDTIEVKVLFDTDIKKELEETARWKSIVESGKIEIDKTDNYLTYGDEAAIVNASAFSIKKLYAEHKTNLLSLNLRYHIKERKRDSVDNDIKGTINDAPASFWLKNNGITIICDSFDIDGREVHLRNFSIVNGGQTTFQIYKNSNIDAAHDFYLPCKIIRNIGETKDDKMLFSLEIAKAANSQKPITQDDLKANAPEQHTFAKEMQNIDVFYQTKRGEKPPDTYPYRKTKLEHVGKLCMAAIFQMPCVSRNRKTLIYQDRHYKHIFIEKQSQIAAICKELLYIEYYFNEKFKRKFKDDNKNEDDANTRISFANKARTICIAFTALAARYHQGNITEEDLKLLIEHKDSTALLKKLRNLGDMKFLLPIKLYTDAYDAALSKLFTAIIKAGTKIYSQERRHDPNLTANSFLQSDKNYYEILNDYWDDLKEAIQEVFADA